MTTETVLTEKDVLSIIDDAIGNPDLEPADCLRDYEVLIRKAELAVLQSPEIHRLQDDAGRYRWLRNESLARAFGDGVLAPVVFKCDDEFQHSDVDHLQLSELDIEIDAAMEILPGNKQESESPTAYPDEDAKYEQAKAVVLQHRRASISLVQRTLRIRYNEAAHYLERMAQDGILSPMASAGNRTIL